MALVGRVVRTHMIPLVMGVVVVVVGRRLAVPEQFASHTCAFEPNLLVAGVLWWCMRPRLACSSTIDSERGDDSDSSSFSLLPERLTMLLLRPSELGTLAGMKSEYVGCWYALLAESGARCLCVRGTVSDKNHRGSEETA